VPTRFSFQLYSARLQPPVNKTIAMLAELGFREVEGFGGVYDEPEKLRKVMDKNGVAMPTGHFGLDVLEKDKKKVLGLAATLGISRLICPWIPPEQRSPTAKGWKDLGKRLSGLAETYRAEGHSLAWHNHDFEFVEFKDGTTPHEHLFDAAPLLDWEIDVAWIVRGKSNPYKWIKRYASAITCVHIKDIAKRGENADEDGWADIGHGTMDWPKIMAAIAETRCVHYVLEHDKPSDVERFAKRSMATLKKL
jgi:sugar phosphate isomerase/epimerase